VALGGLETALRLFPRSESAAIAFRQAHVSAVVQARALALKEAAGPRKRVLDEDTYVDAIEHIVRRDFFPDLPRLDAQLALLDALEAGDQEAPPTLGKVNHLSMTERTANPNLCLTTRN
jgi:hypothetical protein